MRRDIDIDKIDVSTINRPQPKNINELRLLIKSLNISERNFV